MTTLAEYRKLIAEAREDGEVGPAFKRAQLPLPANVANLANTAPAFGASTALARRRAKERKVS